MHPRPAGLDTESNILWLQEGWRVHLKAAIKSLCLLVSLASRVVRAGGLCRHGGDKGFLVLGRATHRAVP